MAKLSDVCFGKYIAVHLPPCVHHPHVFSDLTTVFGECIQNFWLHIASVPKSENFIGHVALHTDRLTDFNFSRFALVGHTHKVRIVLFVLACFAFKGNYRMFV